MNFLRRIMGTPTGEAPEPGKAEENTVAPTPEKSSASNAAAEQASAPKAPVVAESTVPDETPQPMESSTADETNAVKDELAPAETPESGDVSAPTEDLSAEVVPDTAPLEPPTAVPEKTRMIDLSDQHQPMIDSDMALDGVTRPLPQEVVIEVSGSGHAIFGQSTDMGRVRTNNEDAVYSFFATGRSAESIPDFGLFVVADGMGGHAEGERASAIAVRTVANYILRDIYLPLLYHEERDAPVAEVITTAIQRANDAVTHDLEDGGTTVSAAILIGDLAYIGHVGDSRVYMINRGKIERVTRDHSWVQRLIELDQLTPEEANEHPQKNLLYRALGQSDTLEVDTLMRRLSPNARILICSDGLWNQVSDASILQAVNSSDSPSDACTRLIALANEAGGPDNITVIMLQLPG